MARGKCRIGDRQGRGGRCGAGGGRLLAEDEKVEGLANAGDVGVLERDHIDAGSHLFAGLTIHETDKVDDFGGEFTRGADEEGVGHGVEGDGEERSGGGGIDLLHEQGDAGSNSFGDGEGASTAIGGELILVDFADGIVDAFGVGVFDGDNLGEEGLEGILHGIGIEHAEELFDDLSFGASAIDDNGVDASIGDDFDFPEERAGGGRGGAFVQEVG